ncbi:hypothetical protein [Sinorhizobium meliloti]|uniref:hypothetical protein n=1 Tax=Rhizobium meliloti TaxID=382 RepID=UPI000FD98BBE|nr:hypothetical protein [Sinorhizobium meliloti]RVH97625.1 hypothetical protein CN199_07820 [Sinorhizobium meliloti]RVK82296.1 hypothetical protein CN153_26220 [Sinorhizobium meliloti]RVL18197.1 hypothetical protein CN143_19865 [Sinorhizobium meliloti]RVP39449.1 hypothetical protein CN081_08485 [Sinorhizobium meliloti]
MHKLLAGSFLFVLLYSALYSSAISQEKRVGFQNSDTVAPKDHAAVYVDPVKLTTVYDHMGTSLNVGAVVSDPDFAAGLQKAADTWGINLDLFVTDELSSRRATVSRLIDNVDQVIITDVVPNEDISAEQSRAAELAIKLERVSAKGYKAGYDAMSAARAAIVARIPKYDEVLPIAFPISPLPDTFFRPSKFPYPRPLIRVERTSESVTASVHAHTSCNMVAQTGNMLHRTSSLDPDLFLMGMEGGNLSLKAMPGAVDPEKISAVMTSWVLAVRGEGSSARDILVENDGVGTSFFKPGIHAPEELELGLDGWVREGRISGYRRLNAEEVVLNDYQGSDRVFRGGMFLVAFERQIDFPKLEEGVDIYGNRTIEFSSTQSFVQILGEVSTPEANVGGATPNKISSSGVQRPGQFLADVKTPVGGVLTEGGASVGKTVGSIFGTLLQKVTQGNVRYQPYVLSLEGGFMVVTPETPFSKVQLDARVVRIDVDLRGPLTSDQSIVVHVEGQPPIMLRRTILNFDELDVALDQLRAQGQIGEWEYEGVRGRGLNANVVLQHFLGKHRKFMSSLMTWPSGERPDRPIVRMYVDGMQRLNFAFLSPSGWRQEFVEVPLKVPPVPRDVALFSDVSTID